MRYDFDIREVSRGQALDMVTAYHYSDTLPKINRHFLGCFLGGDIVGVVTLELGIRHYKGRQFRYVKLTCGRRERARLLAESLVPLTTDYPKDRDLAWREIDLDTGRWHECRKPDIRTDRSEGAPQLQRALF